MADVGIDTSSIAEPDWQRYQDWARDLIPALISGGLFILVIGAGVLWIVRFQYPRRRPGGAPLDGGGSPRTGRRPSGFENERARRRRAVGRARHRDLADAQPLRLVADEPADQHSGRGVVFLAVAKRFV